MTITEMRPFQDRTVTLALRDGEITTCEIVFVDVEHEDIIVDIIHTNRPDNYRREDSSYAIAVSDVASVREASAGDLK
jgi:hypothetical protein